MLSQSEQYTQTLTDKLEAVNWRCSTTYKCKLQ